TGSGGDVRLSNASISDITIDGNAANHPASTQCSNIVLECLANVTVKNVRSINCNGNGIMLRGTTTTNATNLKILNNTVLNSSSIGIQSSQFDGLVISDNYVDTSADNNIDIYGEDGTTTCHGKNFVISNNICKNGLVGIFPETVRDGVISGNMISGCVSAGIHVNRINGAPRGINIVGNTVTSCPVSMFVTGDTNGVKVSGNYFRDFTTTGVSLGGAGGGNVSGVYITDNYFDPHDTTTYCITTAGSVSSVNRAVGNTMPSTISSAYWINETALTSVSCYYEVPAVGTHPQVTAASIGLGFVDNTSDLAKPVSNAQQAALDLKLDINATAHLNSATNPAPASITGWVSSNPGALPLIYTTASGYGEIRAQRFASGGTGILLCSLTSCGVVGTQVLPAGTHWQFSVDVKPPVDAHTNAGGAFPGGIALAAGVYTRITGTLVGTGAATNPTALIIEANVDPGVTNVFTYLRHALLVQAPATPVISYFDGDSTGASWTGTPNASSSLGAGVLIGVDPSSPQTLSNKRIAPRVSTITSSATPGPAGDTTDLFTVTALATGATFAAPTGTPSDGQTLLIRIKDNGSAQSLAWNAIYRAGSVLLPSTTVVGLQHYLKFIYCAADTKWDLVMAVTVG
ncbi:MAG TPA: right-handed parallel beta-helix repeat-containing protein, partial [Candidatus Saccharimonadales bacterium]